MPRMGDEARRQRRQEFIDAAWHCVASKGYRSLSVDEICAEAGLSKGAFYTHFDSKQDLLLALIEDDATSLEGLIEGVEGAQVSGVQRIRRYLRAILERGDDPARVQMRADLLAEMLTDDAVRARFAETVRRRRQMLAGWVTEAVESGEVVDMPANALASIVLALADGLMLHHSLDQAGFRWQNIRRAVDIVLDGITT